MRVSLLLLWLALFGHLARAAGDTPAGPGESQQKCDLLFRHFARAAPAWIDRMDTVDEGIAMLNELQQLVTTDEAAYHPHEAKQGPANRPTKDGGNVVAYHSNGSGEGAVDAEDFRKLKERIAALQNALNRAYREPSVSVLTIDDMDKLHQFLETNAKVREKRENPKDAAEKCLFIGLFGGGLTAIVSDVPRTEATAERIAERERKAHSRTLDEHLKLVETLLLSEDPQKDEKLREHKAYLAQRAEVNLPVPLGARAVDYSRMKVLYDEGVPVEVLNQLATKENNLTAQTLLDETGLDQPHYFSAKDVEEIHKLRAPNGFNQMAREIGIAAGAAATGFVACGAPGGKLVAKARFTVDRAMAKGGAPELRPLRQFALSSLAAPPPPPGTKIQRYEVLWTGVNSPDGDHRDYFILVDHRHNPPDLKLAAYSWKTSPEYLKPPPPPPAPEPEPPPPPEPPKAPPPPKPSPQKSVELRAIERRFLALYFSGGPKNDPKRRELENLFVYAERLGLEPQELLELESTAKEVHGVEDFRLLKYKLDEFQKRRLRH